MIHKMMDAELFPKRGTCLTASGLTESQLPRKYVEKNGLQMRVTYLTQAEVADRFRITQSTVKNWRAKGLLQYLRVPGSTRVVYPIDSVQELERISLRQEKEVVVEHKEIKRERSEISPKQRKKWRI